MFLDTTGLFLTYLWARASWGRVIVIGVFLAATLLAIRDQYLNRNTLHDQRVARARDGATQLAMVPWESDAGDEATADDESGSVSKGELDVERGSRKYGNC